MALFGTQCASENDRNEVDFQMPIQKKTKFFYLVSAYFRLWVIFDDKKNVFVEYSEK